MTVAATTVELQFAGVVADTPFVVGIQHRGVANEIVLKYGAIKLTAVQGVDYLLDFPLDGSLLTFTITPKPALLTKIAANGPNVVYASRNVAETTDFDFDNAFVRQKLVDEFNHVWMKIQELDYEFATTAAAAASATAAAASASAALASQTAAAASAAAALASQGAAATSAAAALVSQNAAATSATNAANSATAAAGSATAAAGSATAAAGSATTATTQATNASNSASAAATSATNASNSATAAATSATNAAASATTASTQASNASASAAAALTSKNNAATSETNAAASAAAALTSKNNAATSETNAANSASAAATSATNASNSATTASTQATNAAASATTASTQATNASNSATTASTQATNASNSASAAATSATNAANSASAAAASAASINLPAITSADAGKMVVVNAGGTGYNKHYGVLPVGFEGDYDGHTLPPGWLKCDGSNKSRTTYAELFAALIKSATVTISNASPAVITWAAHGREIGDKVRFTTTGTLPTGFSLATDYYVIPAGYAGGSFQLSATPMGAAVNTSSAGSGVHTGINAPHGIGDGSTTFGIPDRRGVVTMGRDYVGSAANRVTNAALGGVNGSVLGTIGGEEAHTPTLAELFSHAHTFGGGTLNAKTNAAGQSFAVAAGANATSQAMDNTGSSAAHNVMQPTAVTLKMIFANV